MKSTEHQPLPSIDYLKSRFRLDRKTGNLFWKARPEDQFVAPRYALTWNKKHAGKQAGTLGVRGYRIVIIDYAHYLEHRIVFALVHGFDPGENVIDHKNPAEGNRPSNLQVTTRKNNVRRKTRMNSNNTSGVSGVWWHTTGKRWVAAIKVNGVKIALGMFTDINEAAAVRRKAEKKYFGKFAPAVCRST